MTTEQNPKKAMMWLSWSRSWQIYTKWKTKRLYFSRRTVPSFTSLVIGAGEWRKLVTLEQSVDKDYPLILIRMPSTLIIITIALLPIFYALNIKGCRFGKLLNVANGIMLFRKEMVHADLWKMDSLYSPSYIAMTFAIIFPVFWLLGWSPLPTTTSNIPHQQPCWIRPFQNFTQHVDLEHLPLSLYICSWLDLWFGLSQSINPSNYWYFWCIIVANQPFVKKTNLWGYLLASFGPTSPSSLSSHSQICLTIVSVPSTPSVLPPFAKIFPFLDGILIPWRQIPIFWTKIALIMMQGWLGFPYTTSWLWGFFNRFQTIFTKLLISMVPRLAKFRNITFPRLWRLQLQLWLVNIPSISTTSPSFTV